jgi:KipI family sensor histidine kinase inhibitor
VIREAGDAGVLITLEPVIDAEVNGRALAIAAAVRDARLPGIRDVVPTYRSVAIHVGPAADRSRLLPRLEAIAAASTGTVDGRHVDIPIVYDGPDLDAVAAHAGLSADAVAERHAAEEYRVFMLGFLPGFPYMGSVDPAIAAPRHPTPRPRVPAGAVGIAGRQTGIYPCDSPGGWQIIGRTALPMFDLERDPPATLAPGDRVRFVRERGIRRGADPVGSAWASLTRLAPQETSITVLTPGLFTTIQDAGRWGYQSMGVPVAGALDQAAYARANQLVGNPPGVAALEVTIVGPELRFERRATLAVTGADLSARLDDRPLPLNRPVACPAGALLRFGARLHGARAYIGVGGGIDVPLVLGSRSTHTLTGMGGPPLRAGDRLAIGAPVAASDRALTSRDQDEPSTGATTLRVRPGPQHDSFAAGALDTLQAATFRVSPRSNRMGYRLEGATIPAPPGEMISDATFNGALQVPPDGAPILLMADRQTIGGYPQLAVVVAADLPRAAQLAPGDVVRFEVDA